MRCLQRSLARPLGNLNLQNHQPLGLSCFLFRRLHVPTSTRCRHPREPTQYAHLTGNRPRLASSLWPSYQPHDEGNTLQYGGPFQCQFVLLAKEYEQYLVQQEYHRAYAPCATQALFLPLPVRLLVSCIGVDLHQRQLHLT